MANMCIPIKLQQNIISFTKDGEHIARFLTETMRGKTPGVKVCHRMEAAKHLIRYGFPDEARQQDQFDTNESKVENTDKKAPSLSTGEGSDGGDNPPQPVTHLDILNYQIAHLIRHETADGHTVVNFLVDIMSGRDRPFTPKKFRIKPADRMAAARELLRRGFGDLGSRRKPSDTTDEANAYDTLHTDLARRMREYSERGTDTVRFLLEVMSDPDPDLEFTIHHRMSAAQELLRRGWDTNYDNIKPKHLQDYWRDKESPRLSVGQKKIQAGLSTSIDDYDNYDDTDYEAIAKEIREEEDRNNNSKPLRFQETVPSSLHSSESRNPEDRQAATPATKLPLPKGEGRGEGKISLPSSLSISDKAQNAPTSMSLPPRRGKARMGVTEPVSKSLPQSESGDTATSKLPLPKGLGRREGTKNSLPPRRGKARMGVKSPAQDPLPNKATTVNEHDKAIIKEFREAMDKGDERAALRAEAKYRRIDTKSEKNIYDYGPNDPDPTIDYYFEPLNPEEQAKFDKKDRREYGLTEEEPATNGSANQPPPNGTADSLAPIKQAAALHGIPIHPNPLAGKRKNPTIRSP